MKIAIIGRTEILYETIELFLSKGFLIPLIITSKEAPEYKKKSKDFEEFANKIGAKYIYTNKLDEYKEEIKKTNCEIAVSLNYSSIISQNVIELFPLGVLNAHGGDLPRYRGNACQAWAIINGEERIGLCIHSMIGGEVDSGNIIDREYLDIDINTKITTIYEWFNQKIPKMFLNSVIKLQKNSNYVLEVQSKNPKEALRCYPRIPEDGKIDWNKSNIEILRLINASNKPYGGAYCNFDDKKLIIWDAELFEDSEIYLAEVGQVANIEKDGSIIVITGNGKLKIKEIECDGFVGNASEKIKSIRKRLL
ncbi:methionyl-tRNA formyltransferase [Aliarcobacter butzleri]|uniref:methionyl-tRNA formyltransferase n=1 Tax=Aliarcobacter butzleri TaxID=28197 RepID=UPI00263D343B|nr:formyltransferase family protein [Aliarcobacter butzleri]MDN5081914.1 formyltransferase family protein [Aliarcobacter butzleri]MDN5084224.1 formyltransferase family protein [Aliarcobacter butzleri]